MTVDGLIAVPGLKDEAAGAICYWRLSGDTRVDTLREEWLRVFPNDAALPSPPTTLRALQRAAETYAKMGGSPDAMMVKPFARSNGFTKLVRQETTGSGGRVVQHWVPQWSVTLENGRVVFAYAGQSESPDISQIVTSLVEKEIGLFSSIDISYWLVRTMADMGAVSLRDTGGFYFVPRTKLGVWKRIVEVVSKASGHQLLSIPAMTSSEASLAIVTALTDEVSSFVARHSEKLDTAKYGKRALEARIQECQEMATKVVSYESLLNAKLDELRENVDKLKVRLVSSHAQAMAISEAS